MDKKQKKIVLRYIDLIIKKRWFIIGPVCLSLIAGLYLAITLPRTYQASTLILVESSKVPSSIVKPLQNEDIRQKISTISEQIMSQTYLDRIVEQHGLFSKPEQKNMFPEDKYRAMRKRIEIDLSRSRGGIEAFKLSYKGGDPEKVKDVANSLAKFFIDQSLEVLLESAVGTRKFLEGELQDMQRQLEKREKALSDYQKRNMGRLPGQLNTNLSSLNRLQQSLDAKQEALADARTRLMDIQNRREEAEKMQQMMMAQMNQLWDDNSIDIMEEDIQPQEDSRLAALKEEYDHLLSRYTEKHPDVVRLATQIKELEKKLQDEQTKETAPETPSPTEPMPETDGMADADAAPGEGNGAFGGMPMMPTTGGRFEEQYVETQREIAKYERDIAEIANQIKVYETRVEDTPKIEAELQSLTRDYNNIKKTYESLLERKLEAQVSESMERQSKGTRFQILDYAKTPQKPISPDMKKLFLVFTAAGFVIGGGIVFLFDFLDGTVRDPEEIQPMVGSAEVVVIPKIYSLREKYFRYFNWALSCFIASITFALFCGFALISSKGLDGTKEIIRNYINI